jgi:hypothetical protein
MKNMLNFIFGNSDRISWKEMKILAQFPHLDDEGKRHVKIICDRILARTGGVVFAGPFSGMRLVPNSFLTSRPVWIVGCYESEIETAILDVISNPPSQIIDIGSAHGYYMVGLATQIDKINVIGFEAESEEHWKEARELAELNGVSERIIQKGYCDLEELKQVEKDNSAILCDCEGDELDILDPSKLLFLKTCRIICEVHDFYRDGATRILIDRFKGSHDIKLITEQNRNPFQYRVLDGFSKFDSILAVRETKHIPGRLTSGKFLFMKPRLNQ